MSFPSAFPSNFFVAKPITFPISFIPFAPVSLIISEIYIATWSSESCSAEEDIIALLFHY